MALPDYFCSRKWSTWKGIKHNSNTASLNELEWSCNNYSELTTFNKQTAYYFPIVHV